MIRKVIIQDEQSHSLEIMFWTESMFPYNKEEVMGQTLVVTSTLVTEYMQKLQLVSTSATVIEINPQAPELRACINMQATFHRLSQLPKSGPSTPHEPIVAIANIYNKLTQDSKQTRFTCKASITELTPNRKWYYVTCPHCPKKLYLQEDKTYECEDDGTILEPIFIYCVNTTIADVSTNAQAVFFNEAMSEMLNITCTNMVVHHRHTDPLIIPPQIIALKGKPTIFQVTVKNDNTMIVNKVTTSTATTLKRKSEHHPAGPETPSKQSRK